MITKLLLTFCIGLAMHRTERWVDYIIKTAGWNQLTKYTIGVTSAFPFFVMLFNDVVDYQELPSQVEKHTNKMLVVSYFLSYLFYGMGTAVGYILEAVQK